MAAVAQHAVTSTAVQDLASELLPDARALSRRMGEHLYAAIPELAAIQDDELRAELFASTRASVDQVLRTLASGGSADDVVAAPEVLALARGNVRRGIPLAALLRSGRLGHAWLWEEWSRALGSRVLDAAELAAAQEQSLGFMFAYIDKVSDVLVEEFATERERMVRSAEQLRAETTRAILAGEPVDLEVASRQLGYELRRHHVAMRLWSGAAEVRGLERAVGEAAAALGEGKPLVVASGAASYDVWWGSFDPPETDALGSYEPPAGVLCAFGKPGHGVAGFRSSHAEALQAARVSSLAGAARSPVTSYARVELVSLLASDLPRARAFLAGQLGPLASASASAQRLRDTLLAFLASGGSATRVAKQLHVHHNTVVYRVKKAEEALGHKAGDSPVELTAALTLAAALGPAVLAGEGDGNATRD